MIPGIYNYCDRWCERCPFAARCENYAPYFEGDENELIARDNANKLFWDKIDSRIPQVLDLVNSLAEERGVDISDIEIIKNGKKFDLFQGKAQTNEVLKVGRKYEDQVDDWFDDACEKYPIRAESFTESELKLAKGSGFENVDEINEAIDIIFRYQLQIYLKLSRAFFSKGKELAGEQEGDDSVGAARLVMEFIERSLVSWHVIYTAFEKEREAILPVIFNLASLRNRMLKEFPEVMSFKRAGFDE
jgi:hypothetical protein